MDVLSLTAVLETLSTCEEKTKNTTNCKQTPLAGLQAVPLAVPRLLQKTSSSYRLPDGFRQGAELSDIRTPVLDGFRQGTEPSWGFVVDLNTVHEHISEMERRVGKYNYNYLNTCRFFSGHLSHLGSRTTQI